MNHKPFITPKGAELPFMDLQGKPYLQVAHRIMWFREEHTDWLIETSFPVMTDKYFIVRAAISDSEGKLRAVAHRIEFKYDDLEKAETGAIGRALGFLGFGTQFAMELREDGTGKLADAPIQRGTIPNHAEGIGKPAPGTDNHHPPVTGEQGPIKASISEAQAKRYYAMCKVLGWNADEHLRKSAGVVNVYQLAREQYVLITSKLQFEIDKAKK